MGTSQEKNKGKKRAEWWQARRQKGEGKGKGEGPALDPPSATPAEVAATPAPANPPEEGGPDAGSEEASGPFEAVSGRGQMHPKNLRRPAGGS